MLKRLVLRLNSHAATMTATGRRVAIGLLVAVLFVLLLQSHSRSQHDSFVGVSDSKGMSVDSILAVPNTPAQSSSGMSLPWGVSYSPLLVSGACKPLNQVANDLNELKRAGFTTVRFFSNDCHVLDAVSSVSGLKVVIGIVPFREFNVGALTKSVSSQLAGIDAWGHWNRISMVVVGSQGIFAGEYTAQELVQMLRFVRAQLITNKKFQGILTTAEPVQSWASVARYNALSLESYQSYRQARDLERIAVPGVDEGALAAADDDLCAAVDAIGLVVQPYFSAVGSYEAGDLVERDAHFAQYLCSDAFVGASSREDSEVDDGDIYVGAPRVAVLEAGWPKEGLPNLEALAGQREQKEAIESMLRARDPRSGSRIPITLYSYNDELSVDAGELQVEQSFGVRELY